MHDKTTPLIINSFLLSEVKHKFFQWLLQPSDNN